MNAVRVLLFEDHSIVREGLRALLSLDESIILVGESASGKDAIELYGKLQPDVVVMDVAMPELNGFESTRQIIKAYPEAKILVLSAHSDDEYVEFMTKLGAMGYMVKQNSIDLLRNAIHEIANGKTYFSPSIAERRKKFKSMADELGISIGTMRRSLTKREAEVLQRVAEGELNKQIARNLGISIKTVEKHRQQLMDKLNIHDIAGITRYAIATGVIESSQQTTIDEPNTLV